MPRARVVTTVVTALLGLVVGSVVVPPASAGTSEPVPGAVVELWARPHGADWRRVATDTSDENGGVEGHLRVHRTTTVEWRFAGAGGLRVVL